MKGFEGALALRLDFGGMATQVTGTGAGRQTLRLAPRPGRLTGPDKYKVLEHRRRQAQIEARHLLDLTDREQAQ
jgi:hypothetical protein